MNTADLIHRAVSSAAERVAARFEEADSRENVQIIAQQEFEAGEITQVQERLPCPF